MKLRMKRPVLFCVAIAAWGGANADVPLDLPVSFGTEMQSPEAVVAAGFNSFCSGLISLPNKTSDQIQLADICSQVATSDPTDTADVFAAVSARAMSAETTSASRGVAVDLRGGVEKRLSSLLRMATLKTSSAQPVEFYFDGRWIPASWVTAAAEDAANASSTSAEPEGLLSQRWGGFFDLGLMKEKQDEAVTQAGFKSNIDGLTAGADYRLQNNAYAGGAIRYRSVSGDLNYSTGSVKGADTTLTLYGAYFATPKFILQTALIYAAGGIDLTRNISFDLAGVPTTATAKSTANTTRTGISVDGYYNFDFGNGGVLSTSASLLYGNTSIDPFVEKGAGGFNLKVDGQSTNSTTLNISAQYTHAISTSFAVVIPELSGTVVKELVTDPQQVTASFAADPSQTSFHYQITKRDDLYGNVGLGATCVFTKGRSGFVRYEQLVGYDKFKASSFSLGGRMEF